jgi:hypothetical protein
MTPLRLAAAVAVIVLLTIGGAGLVLATRGTGGSATPPLPTIAPAKQEFPVPPPGAVVFAREDGPDALALAVVPQGTGALLQASVVDGQGAGVTGLQVSFAIAGRSMTAATCGPGCYRASTGVSRPMRVTVDVRGDAAATVWPVPMPSTWPPPDATKLLARAATVWRHLRTVVVHDSLRSDPTHVLYTEWKIVAPNRISYVIRNGNAGIVIGNRRWDRVPGDVWRSSPQTPVRQPVPTWSAVTDAHVVGSATLNGQPVWRVTFFDPHGLAWFEVLIDKQSALALDLKMTTTAHFMHEAYGPFNARIRVVPPR